MNPIVNNQIAANGKRAWFGWPDDAKLEQMRDTYARATSPEDQKKLAMEIQKEAYEQVIYVPLGQFRLPSAWRKSLTGVLEGPAPPVFWNVDKTE
ncbi:ABC-type transport system substrate-binding protein [Bradyrhizobium sp. JR3.5]